MVCILITSALIFLSDNLSAATMDSHTKCPVAIIVISLPSINLIPYPISNFWFSGVKTGTFGLPNQK